jgi:hypothetical protein
MRHPAPVSLSPLRVHSIPEFAFLAASFPDLPEWQTGESDGLVT